MKYFCYVRQLQFPKRERKKREGNITLLWHTLQRRDEETVGRQQGGPMSIESVSIFILIPEI